MEKIMKKFLSILLAVLVIGACATTDASAKKRVTKGKKATKTAVTTVEKGAFAGFWEDPWDYRPVILDIKYDEENDSYWGEADGQDTICELTGKVKGNTLYLTGSKGQRVTCTLKGGKLYVKTKVYSSRKTNFILEPHR